jgi:flagellar biosynthesis protein FlhG
MKLDRKTKMIFSVGGGKGGVGKSIFSIALGVALAKSGHDVALIDLDLGAANLHTYLGILGKTPTIADFILAKVSSLEDILVKTSQKNLRLISGSAFVPGMANPAHWMKLKIVRHVKSLPSDFVVIDLGAGVHFSILDFFGISDRGIVITVPEPGAVMNAYGFIKAALFRRLQNIFRNHPEIGPAIDSEIKGECGEDSFTLEWFSEKVEKLAPDMFPLIEEIEKAFRPSLVINRVPEGQAHILVKNLITLCTEKLGVTIEHVGNIPDVKEIAYYLLNIPKFFNTSEGKTFFASVQRIVDHLAKTDVTGYQEIEPIADFTDEEIEEIIRLIEILDDSIFRGTNRNIWKLKMYFKPLEVVNFLARRGAGHMIPHRLVKQIY